MRINKGKLKKIVTKALVNNGVDESSADLIAETYITADEYGVSTHGVRILSAHIDKIKQGGYNLKPDFKTVKNNVSFSVIDGNNSFGPLCANYCMDLAIDEAINKGIYTVFSYNNNTYGAAFYYSLQAVKKGLIGIAFCNSPAAMAPIGGYEKLLGTNPISIAIPANKHDAIILDMATSKVAKSKLKIYADKGEKIPNDIALDKDGNATDDPNLAIQGTLLPIAGYKGYGLSMMIDILSGLISGAAFLNNVGSFYNSKDKCMNVGFTFIAIDPKQIYGDEFYDKVDDYCSIIESSGNLNDNHISVCGYNMFERYSDSKKNGIELDNDVLKRLEKLANEKNTK